MQDNDGSQHVPWQNVNFDVDITRFRTNGLGLEKLFLLLSFGCCQHVMVMQGLKMNMFFLWKRSVSEMWPNSSSV